MAFLCQQLYLLALCCFLQSIYTAVGIKSHGARYRSTALLRLPTPATAHVAVGRSHATRAISAALCFRPCRAMAGTWELQGSRMRFSKFRKDEIKISWRFSFFYVLLLGGIHYSRGVFRGFTKKYEILRWRGRGIEVYHVYLLCN